MIDRLAFAEGLTKIGIAVRQPADAATMAVYHDVVGADTDADEWRRFVRWALDGARWRWFPKCPELHDALREFRGHRPLLAEATEAYDRVLAAGDYAPEGGTSWTFRAIRERCGEAAALGFLAAGGNAAFSTTWDESKRRERFAAGYAEAVRENGAAGLLPAGAEVKALPAPAAPSAAEAREILRSIAPKAPAPKPKRQVVIASDERLAKLRAQAQEILAGTEAAPAPVAPQELPEKA